MANIFCTLDVQDWVIKECDVERAGVIAMLLYDIDEHPDSNNLQSLSYLQGRLAASPTNWVLIQPARGEYQGGAPTEEEGFGTESVQITGADHTATVEAEGLATNWAAVEGINRKHWGVILFTNAGFEFWIQVPVSVYGKIMNPKSIKSGAFWQFALKWTDYTNPRVLTTPSGFLADVG